MDSYTNIQTSALRRPIRPLARYRVMARHHDQGQGLVTLAENARQAANLAKAFCDTIATDRDGILSVRVEEWVGTLAEGEWQPMSVWHGGFSHRFTPQLSTRTRNGDRRNPTLPRAGTTIQCVLMGEKTRKGGWKARLLQCPMEGPITNTVDVSKSAKPGEVVMLRVGAISHDGKRIQFHWHEGDNTRAQ